MTRYMSPTCEYVPEGRRIRAVEPKMKKVSGTMMAGILGRSPWASPFTVSCDLLGLAREDISDKPAVKTGIALEETIIAYADRTYTGVGSFISADKIYEKRKGDHASWVSDFDDDMFAGHVDGIVFDAQGDDYILEVKTSANMESWAEGVPEYYYWQIALYNAFICKKRKAYVLLGIVDEETHRNPMCWVPNERTVALYEIVFDDDEVYDGLERVREWYAALKETKTTTECNVLSDRDMEMLQHLILLATDIGEMRTHANRLCELSTVIDGFKEDMSDSVAEFDALKEKLKAYMDYNDVSILEGDGGSVVMGTQSRTSWDEDAMVADGIDPAKYKKTDTTNTIRIKKVK